MKHTATPWRIGMKPGPIIYGPHGETVTHLMILENERIVNCANAAFIVRACNAHDDLLAACNLALTRMADMYGRDFATACHMDHDPLVIALRTAIRKAEEE